MQTHIENKCVYDKIWEVGGHAINAV